MSTRDALVTADDLLKMSHEGERLELIRGELRRLPLEGWAHGLVAANVVYLIGSHLRDRGSLGELFAAGTGFILGRDPDTVRAPDAAFVSREMLSATEAEDGFLELAPDLAAEVVSPSDSAPYVKEKVETWLRAGVRVVWVVYPSTKSVAVYRGADDVRLLTGEDKLRGDPALSDFSCSVNQLF